MWDHSKKTWVKTLFSLVTATHLCFGLGFFHYQSLLIFGGFSVMINEKEVGDKIQYIKKKGNFS